MSVSSGSDVTIPIQDSPPPPPSPYANRTAEDAETGRRTPDPRRDVTGIENKGFNSDMDLKKSKDDDKKSHTEINMANGADASNLNEAVNSELINMNIMNTIPAKPQSEFGPYEQMDDYFIPVNTHKKFLRRSEKLYVTKDKRKESHCKKYLCWTVGAFILAAIVAVAVLAAVGIIPQNSDPPQNSVVDTGTAGSVIQFDTSSPPTSVPSSSTPTTTTLRPPTISPDNTYVPMAADVEFHITNMHYEAALHNKSSEQFSALSSKIQSQMKQLLKETSNLEGVQIRINEFAPGSILVKLRIGWMNETVDFQTIQFRLANVTSFGEFEIRTMSSYQVVHLCKFNKNGCSNFCTYDFESLEFMCTCPETMLLDTDSKTCKASIESESSSSIPEVASAEPSAEPETASEDSTAAAEPEPEPEIIAQEASESPIVSSSATPEIELIPSELSTSTTTGSPRLEEIDTSVSEDASEVVQTTVTPVDDEPVPETPADSGSHDESHDSNEQPASSTSTTTTEVPLIVSESPVESESHAPDESEPVPETPADENQSHDHAPIESEIAETTTAPESADEEVPIVPEIVAEETTSKSEDAAEQPAQPAESRESETPTDSPSLAVSHDEHEILPVQSDIINPIDVLALGTSSTTSTTTTEGSTSTTSSTTEASAVIAEELHSQPEEPLFLNLQRDVSEQSQESSVESPDKKSVEIIAPTNQPTSQEDNVPDNDNTDHSESISSQSSTNNNSSERTGRQEMYVEKAVASDEETTSVPVISSQERQKSHPVPGSAEFMVYGDIHPTLAQTSIVGLLNSKELTGSDETDGSSIGSSDETAVLPSPSSSENLQASREIEETTTFKSISLHKDIDVNHLDNVTEDKVHSENVHDKSGEKKAELQENLKEDSPAETTVISIEQEEVDEPANRDHREAAAEVDTTLSPVVFDEEGVTSDPSAVESTSTSTSTTPSPVVSNSPSSTAQTIISTTSAKPQESSPHGNESENELIS